MNREILFRGKRVDNGDWVYGSLCQHSGRVEILVAHSDNILDYDLYKVDPTTVGQFTGRLNKEGERIFEGDKTDDGVVFWSNDYLGFFVNDSDNKRTPFYDIPIVETTGNIHDNPELVNS